MIASDVMVQLLKDVVLDNPPHKKLTKQERQMRSRLRKEVAEIRANGGVVDLPPEIA